MYLDQGGKLYMNEWQGLTNFFVLDMSGQLMLDAHEDLLHVHVE
jgi:hypothetical protein